MNLGDLNKVWEIRPLKKAGEDQARKMLDKIARQVQPIMKKHKWTVKLLSEFSPTNPSLLGLNIGDGLHIQIRLRRPNRDWDFLPYNQLLDTMLHELCHNDHGPHNSAFYNLWDEIRKECEELIGKGVTGTGEGFDCVGRRLGGFTRHPDLNKTALAAAEKRARVGSLLPSGPKRLGGDSAMMAALSPLQAAAMAAERRMQDELWCGSQAFGGSFEEGSNSDMVQEFPPKGLSGESSMSSTGFGATNLPSDMGPESGIVENSAKASTSLDHRASDGTMEKMSWECEICTLLNPTLAIICEACGVQKPKDLGMKFKIWSCKFCTLDNSVKLDKCSACGQWRYSHGAPVSSRLNLDT